MILPKEFNAVGGFTLSGGDKRARLGITLLALTSFMIQFFNKVLNSYLPYAMMVMMAFLLIASAKHSFRIPNEMNYIPSWIPFLGVLFVNAFIRNFTIGFALDWVSFTICVMFVLLSGRNLFVFEIVLKVVLIVAFLYAASVWFQLLFPGLYTIYLRLLPAEDAYNILLFRRESGAVTGFSTNPGFTSGHLACGIVALFSAKPKNSREKKINLFLFLVYFSALLLTGKRSPLLTVVFACMITYLVLLNSGKRLIVIHVLVIGTIGLVAFLVIFNSALSNVPAVGRVSDTLVGLINGEDITNGRSKLYAFAVKRFLDHPIIGIGWGQFRNIMVGTVTLKTEMDVHNIYLQLLCETGIVGGLSAFIPMLLFLYHGFRNLLSTKKERILTDLERQLCVFSFCYQLFFLGYGISGNPLYDYNYIMMYFISCAMTALISRKLKRGNTI